MHLQHIRGHQGIEGNEGADALAGLGCGYDALPERPWAELERDISFPKTSENVVGEQVSQEPGPVTAAVNEEDIDLEVGSRAIRWTFDSFALFFKKSRTWIAWLTTRIL